MALTKSNDTVLIVSSNCQGPVGVCGNGQLLPTVHPCCCTDNITSLWGNSRQTQSTGLEWCAIESLPRHQEALVEVTLLNHPRHNVPTSLTTDASDQPMGACHSPTVCEWHLGTPSIFQQEAVTTGEKVQHLWVGIAYPLPGHMTLPLYSRGTAINRLH